MSYPNTCLYIDGRWTEGGDAARMPVEDPATGQVIGEVAVATSSDVEAAAQAAARAFPEWRNRSAFDRYRLMREAAVLLRQRAPEIAQWLTLEQGKPLPESLQEILVSADFIDWVAEEGRRIYGRIVPSRLAGVQQTVRREPVGPVAAFTPWNFPVSQVVRKLAAALAAGCTIIVKAPEETPAAPAALVRAFADAGLPPGVVNLLYGDPAAISEQLIAHPAITKLSFTGSTAVGKHLASLAGRHMKRATMELGGHAPVIVCEDADLDRAVTAIAASKFRNAGQVCSSPTRFLVQEAVYLRFVETMSTQANALRVGSGLEPDVQMGPLANRRRYAALARLVDDARGHGATVHVGGAALERPGYFFAPTVLGDVPVAAAAMNEEPFGPLALVNSFKHLDEAIEEANRLPVGLAAFAFTRSDKYVREIEHRVRSGMVSINHPVLGLPEVPFGGVRESGYGAEGGTEVIQNYLVDKLVTHAVW